MAASILIVEDDRSVAEMLRRNFAYEGFRVDVAGDGAAGPCLVEEQYFTAWIRPGWRFAVTGNRDLLVTLEGI